MAFSERFSSDIQPPEQVELSSHILNLNSQLGELLLYRFEVETSSPAHAIAQMFERYPRLPGVVLMEDRQFLGMISRLRFLEYLIRPRGLDLFLSASMGALHSYSHYPYLSLPITTPIVQAAQLALKRSPELHGEPVVVQRDTQTYYLLDAHELNIAYWQIRGIETQARFERTQMKMIQNEKMASLGRLVDGIAHEILDPVGFIWGNLSYVAQYSEQLVELLSAYQAAYPDPPSDITALEKDYELDYLQQDLPRAIASIQSGANRLKKLVTSLQNFCHIDDVYPKPANLHDCLDSIILLMQNSLSGDIKITRNYGHLPPVMCYVGQVTQVFMNILTNGVNVLIDQAIRLRVTENISGLGTATRHMSQARQPEIVITTQIVPKPDDAPNQPKGLSSRWVSISICNNGLSLSEEQRQKIREAFSVEHRMMKETSWSMSYQIITSKHGGKLTMRSPCFFSDPAFPGLIYSEPPASPLAYLEGEAWGTEFEILLPLV
jgi:signal transduction histidine kinase